MKACNCSELGGLGDGVLVMTKRNTGQGSWPKPPNRPVKDHAVKLQFFFRGVAGNGQAEEVRCDHNFWFQSRLHMAEALGVTDAQLEGTTNGLSDVVLNALAKQLGFDTKNAAFMSGTPVEFAAWWNANNTYDGRFAVRPPVPSSEHAKPPITTRRTDALIDEDQDARSQGEHTAFASLSLWIDKHSDEPGVAYVRPELICHDPMGDGIIVTIKNVLLEFELGQAQTVRSLERYGGAEPFPHQGTTFMVHSTDAISPSWSVKADDDCDIGRLLNLPNDFIKLLRVAPGDIVRARLCGQGRDLDVKLTFKFKLERELTRPELKIASLLKKHAMFYGEDRKPLAAAMIAFKERAVLKAKDT
jgi:hypothetical protein